MMFMNCLLKYSALSSFVIAILLLKFIVLFVDCGGFLFDRFAIVFQCMCVFVLWSQLSFRCSFHKSSLFF